MAPPCQAPRRAAPGRLGASAGCALAVGSLGLLGLPAVRVEGGPQACSRAAAETDDALAALQVRSDRVLSGPAPAPPPSSPEPPRPLAPTDASEDALDEAALRPLKEAIRRAANSTGHPPGLDNFGPFHEPNWDARLPELVAQFEANTELTALLQGALDFAAAQLREHRAAIEANLRATGVDSLDLLWPGDGYNEAAYGGNFQVLSLLDQQGVLKLGKIMGASGGACSTLLSLADHEASGALVLKYNMIYAQQHISAIGQLWRETTFWSAVYRSVLQPPDAFRRVSERGRVACCCGWASCVGGTNSVFYNFKTVEQAVDAYYASGDASIGGLLLGTRIVPAAGKCMDGGSPVPFQNGTSPLLYYNAFFGHSLAINSASEVAELFKQGVTDTIALLQSDKLTSYANGKPVMMAVTPGASGHITDADFAKFTENFGAKNRQTVFYDIGSPTCVTA